MANLSPAAQAVLEAFKAVGDGYYTQRGKWVQDDIAQLAAALRAAADQPYEVPPHYEDTDYWMYRRGREAEKYHLRMLASELEEG